MMGNGVEVVMSEKGLGMGRGWEWFIVSSLACLMGEGEYEVGRGITGWRSLLPTEENSSSVGPVLH